MLFLRIIFWGAAVYQIRSVTLKSEVNRAKIDIPEVTGYFMLAGNRCLNIWVLSNA